VKIASLHAGCDRLAVLQLRHLEAAFFRPYPCESESAVTSAVSKPNDPHPLDALTGGAFSAPTSGERAARIREWLNGEPSSEQLQEVFKEMSARDKGAAKPLREKLDELKRARGQEAIAAEWARKAEALLALPKLNMADALAWQRDAAKAGAPLSKEPLAGFKGQLADRVKGIEDLQHRVQVQREAAVLLAQRIEVLSTKSWRDAQASVEVLRVDVEHWQAQAAALATDANWTSVDVKFPPLLEASKGQLQLVWEAFQAALVQAVAAADDAAAPLPPVPVWADELRVARGVPTQAEPAAPAKPRVDPEVRAQSTQAVRDVLAKLEQEIAEGHGKASAGAAAALRNALKEHGKLIGDKLENQAHAALAAAGELEGWQRWRADQLREELVAKAEGLLKRPEGQAIGGRKMQDTLRQLREQWKQTDQGGVPNHALWKRFDEACNEAHKVVEAWLEKMKAESAEHRAQRLALIEEVKAWAADNATARDDDWKGFNRILYQFGDRWREAGHLSEKAFAELQPMWKEAIATATAPLAQMQKQSLERRNAMIEEAKVLGAAPMLRIDAVKSLQQRWQAEAQGVPLDRKHEQKLWDAFRKPIDDAFQRKTDEREKAASALSDRDRVVLEAAKTLEAANASGDAQKIRSAMSALDAALRGQAQAQAAVAAASEGATQAATLSAPATAQDSAKSEAAEQSVADAPASADDAAPATTADAPAPAPAASAAAPRKPVVAVRGDDRPGMRKAEPAPAGRGGKFGDRKDGPRRDGKFGDRPPRADGMGGGRDSRDGGRGAGRFGDRPPMEDRGPRLGDTAFRAQRDALEHAQSTLKKLAAQAHGEALTQLLGAWEKRDASQLPTAQELGSRVTPATRHAWTQALGGTASGDAREALLRLEIAAEAPTPAEHLSERRLLQLQLLTKRNDPAPDQTWGQDAARVLASTSDAQSARRLQNALKALLRK
jgi:ATP-dependent RNA helicase SUPV3L1/SUV3